MGMSQGQDEKLSSKPLYKEMSVGYELHKLSVRGEDSTAGSEENLGPHRLSQVSVPWRDP